MIGAGQVSLASGARVDFPAAAGAVITTVPLFHSTWFALIRTPPGALVMAALRAEFWKLVASAAKFGWLCVDAKAAEAPGMASISEAVPAAASSSLLMFISVRLPRFCRTRRRDNGCTERICGEIP